MAAVCLTAVVLTACADVDDAGGNDPGERRGPTDQAASQTVRVSLFAGRIAGDEQSLREVASHRGVVPPDAPEYPEAEPR